MVTREQILSFALQNAQQYGKADVGAVFGKVMGTFPEARGDIPATKKLVAETVAEVNAMPAAERGLTAKLPAKEQREQKQDLPDLPGAGKVVTRFAPAPTGALSIFHVLRPIMINYLYAKKYKGKFIVRLEDTDPEKIEKEFYRWIAEDLRALGVRWSQLTRESDDMPAYYAAVKTLVANGAVYACVCPADTFKQLKLDQRDCSCRNNAVKKNKEMLDAALRGNYKEGEIAFRFKTSMQDPNPAVRDPPLLRVVDSAHPLTGKKYKLWPLYNFANVVSDHRQGITHVFRGKEHQNNSDIQDRLYRALGWIPPTTLNFGMIRLETGTLHKRDIKKMIAEKTISGWDDPKLPTVRALLRRGIQPQAFVQAALSVGLTKNDITFTLDKLETANRRLIDPKANRYMAVLEPVRVSVTGAAATTVLELLHPDFPKRGKKKMPFGGTVYLSKEDYTTLQHTTFRLKGFGNIRLDGTKATYMGNELVQEMPKVQWVSEPNVPILVRTPTGDRVGLGEVTMKKIKRGQLLQLERIGFARVDTLRPLVLYFAHK